jgi:outer membrane cobalamin receptor
MKMRLPSFAVLLAVLIVAGFKPAWAEEGGDDIPFVSLTRRPDTLQKLPTNVTVLTEKDIKATGSKTLDELLDYATSVDVQHSGSFGTFSSYRVRGVPSSRSVQLFIDDEPFAGIGDQTLDISQIPLDNVERVEIVRGGSSVLYGANAVGALVHVITKRARGEGFRGGVSFEGRSFQTNIVRADAGVQKDGTDASITGGGYDTGGFQTNSDAKMRNVEGTVGHSFGNGARVAVDVFHTNSKVGNPNGTNVPVDDWNGDIERDSVEHHQRADQDRTQFRLT